MGGRLDIRLKVDKQDMLNMAIISPGNAMPTKDLTPHDALHKRAVVGLVKWMKCDDAYLRLAAVCR